MKKIFSLILCFTLVLSFGFSKETEENYYYNEAVMTKTMKAKKYNVKKAVKTLMEALPSETTYLTVNIEEESELDELASWMKSKHKRVCLHLNLSENINNIKGNTFSSCKSLKFLIIDGPLYTIDEKAFASCSNLENIVLPNTVSHISDTAFLNCLKLNGLLLANDNVKLFSDTQFYINYITLDQALSFIKNTKDEKLDLSIYLEDDLDIFKLLNELEYCSVDTKISFDFLLDKKVKTFDKNDFSSFTNVSIKNVKEIE